MLSNEQWDQIVLALRSADDVDAMCAAAEWLHRSSTLDDAPRLSSLLNDDDAIVREAAAWPLSELAGVAHLRELLNAYQRGFDDGLDNDGFTTALIELAVSRPAELAQSYTV